MQNTSQTTAKPSKHQLKNAASNYDKTIHKNTSRWGPFGLPFGTLGAPLGLPWAQLVLPLAPIGLPWTSELDFPGDTRGGAAVPKILLELCKDQRKLDFYIGHPRNLYR